jgi:hypothetical protein
MEVPMAVNRTTFEYQVTMLMLTAAGADSEFSQQELSSISASLNELFFVLKKNENSLTYLKSVLDDIVSMTEEEVEGTIGIALSSLKGKLPKDQLEVVYKNMKAVAEADGLVQAESDFLDAVRAAWF